MVGKSHAIQRTGLIDRINFVTMLGDTYKALKQLDKAKEAYNQGVHGGFTNREQDAFCPDSDDNEA